MRDTSFGSLVSLTLPWPPELRCELMQFDSEGKPHMHGKRDELALLVAGSGVVAAGDEHHRLTPGEYVVVEAGTIHWMIPDEGGMTMLIAYRRKE